MWYYLISLSNIPSTRRRSFRARRAYLFCSSSLASSSTSSGLSWAGVDGDRAGEESDVEEEVAVVCRDVGAATWLAIWLTVWDTEFFTHERVALSLPETLSVATCGGRERSGKKSKWCDAWLNWRHPTPRPTFSWLDWRHGDALDYSAFVWVDWNSDLKCFQIILLNLFLWYRFVSKVDFFKLPAGESRCSDIPALYNVNLVDN